MCTPSWGSAFNYLLACFRGESHARGVRNSGVIGGEGHGCHAVLFSVCCRRHLFVLASVLFVNATHLGPRTFSNATQCYVWDHASFSNATQCVVCACVCVYAKGERGASLPAFVQFTAPRCSSSCSSARRSTTDTTVPFLICETHGEPMLDDNFDNFRQRRTTSSSQLSTLYRMGASRTRFPFGGFPFGGFPLGRSRGCGEVRPLSEFCGVSLDGGRRTVGAALSLSLSLCAGSVEDVCWECARKTIAAGQGQKGRRWGERQWQCEASAVQGLQNGCSGAGLGWCGV